MQLINIQSRDAKQKEYSLSLLPDSVREVSDGIEYRNDGEYLYIQYMVAKGYSEYWKSNMFILNYSSISSQLRKAKDKKKELKSQNTALLEENSNLKLENDELSNGAQKQLSDIKNAYEKGEWQNVIDLSSALHEKYNGSEEDIEAQQLAKTSQENIDKQKAAEEAEKAKGYETGITYDQLARTPDDYEGQKIKFYGKVIQVMESDSSVTIRLAVNDDYDTILYGQYFKSIVSSRVLEDDYITVYGTSVGTISYQSTMGGTITIPGVYIEKIEQ